MPRVVWSQVGADAVEGVVGVLLCRQNPEATRIQPSRGDGGIDVLVPAPGAPRTIEVYQVKSFTGRLTSSRRSQVERSLGRLQRFCTDQGLEVSAWYLTVPITPTTGERDWFLRLTADAGFPCHWRGLDFLDGLAARYPDVIDYYLHQGRHRLEAALASTGEALRLAQRVAQRPTGAEPGDGDREPRAMQPAEAITGLRGVYDVLNRSDPHFRYDFTASGRRPEIDQDEHLLVAVVQQGTDEAGWITVKIFALFREAVIERPIPGRIAIDPTGSDELARDLELFEDYGRGFRAPPGTVCTELDLPGGLGGHFDGAGARIGPAATGSPANPPEELRLAVLDTADEVVVEIRVLMAPWSAGARGFARIGREQHGAFTIEMLTEQDGSHGSLHVTSLPINGQRPEPLLDGLRFVADFRAPHRFRLRPGYGPGAAIQDIPATASPEPHATWAYELVDALSIVQQATVEQILIPDEVSAQQWDSLLLAARLLRGEIVPGTWTHVGVHLHPGRDIDPAARFAVRAFGALTVELDGREIDLGLTQLDLPAARIDPERTVHHDDHRQVQMIPAGSDVAQMRYYGHDSTLRPAPTTATR